MRFLKIIMVILVLSIFTVPLLSCNSESDEAEQPEYQPATVQRGDIVIDITAAGNLALSLTEDLAFDLFYGQSGASGTKGTVGEVLVEEGDTDWRKNKCDNDDNGIFDFHDGVDNNRNYDFGWGIDDGPEATTPESLTYKGEAPFTQTENIAMAEFGWMYRRNVLS